METDQIMIHVRFAADGTVTDIGERPATLTAQAWFNRLSNAAGEVYSALSGGRGLFRLTREQLTALATAES